MAKVVGYARVSTKEQNLDRQLKVLSEYVEPDMIVIDKASGKNLDRPGYLSLKHGIGKLSSGDTLYISSIDRLSRDKRDIKRELQHFKDTGVRVRIVDLPTTMIDFPQEQSWVSDMVFNILIEVLSSVSEQERETIRQRQRQGLNAMRIDETTGKRISSKTGNPIGRPSAVYPPNWVEVYNQWQAGEITAVRAMSMLDLKRSSFYKLSKQYAARLDGQQLDNGGAQND